MQERVFKRKVLDANILKEMHANNVMLVIPSIQKIGLFLLDLINLVMLNANSLKRY
ncbi:hypothetical protein oki288_12310 [Helicobacter pylori]|nr:hypothetical protein HPF23_0100 [Helicobacter pylori]BAW63515.1 hypothetical protein HPF75_0106 [Helicobacter pylori]GHQ84043.1 hypothetical protein JP0079_00220 [Helicobacter pylori]GHQ94109.1 hypothetical protein JP0086_03570 [Helicobacter pylori]GHQ97935.1 hypothetical protein JP0087_01780 [Helicobacter pylori]